MSPSGGARTPRAPSLAARTRAWEQASAASDDPLLADARRRWQSLTPARQMDLARCLAQCRRSEFTRTVRSVVSVAAGLRRRNDAAGVEHLHNAPCVVFLVRRKLSAAQLARQPAQQLPAELLTPAWIEGREQAVAVPTDVQVLTRVMHARAQAVSGVRADDLDGRFALGVVAWPVTVGGKRFALAPIHVLSPLPNLDGVGRRAGARASPHTTGGQATGAALLQATAHGGRLVAGGAASFDAQLAALLSPAGVGNLFGGLRLSASRPWVRTDTELDALLAGGSSLEIHPPINNGNRPPGSVLPLQAARSLDVHPMPLGYDFEVPPQRQITHEVMELQVRFGECTHAGDSGCPVLLRHADDGLTLVGMHIAGDPSQGLSYMIPIWHLLDPDRYLAVNGSVPAGTIKPVLVP